MASDLKPRLVKKGGGTLVAAGPAPVHVPKPIPVFMSGAGKADLVFDLTSNEGGSLDFDPSVFASMQDALNKLPQYARQGAGIEMSNFLWEVIDLAKEIVPQETGQLRDTGMADDYGNSFVSDLNPGIIELRCWFGAPSGVSAGTVEQAMQTAKEIGIDLRHPEDYAEAQHENLYEHYTTPGTGPKYLEKPFNAKIGEVAPRIAAAVGKAMGSDVMGLGMDPGEYSATFGSSFGFE